MDNIRKKALAVILIDNLCDDLPLIKKRRGRNVGHRRQWLQPHIAKRKTQGAFNNLLSIDLMPNDKTLETFIRMDNDLLKFIVNRVAPLIHGSDTQFREAISVMERVGLTLRFLATGESYHSLSFQFCVGISTISNIIPEVCSAIYETIGGVTGWTTWAMASPIT
jgi:hypothetical protein